jgi:hypothetical protein
LATIPRSRHPLWMDHTASEPVRVQVVATAPLLRAGLERAALAAGLRLTNSEASAAIGLHTPDTAPTDANINLSVGANQVTIALTAIPEREIWRVVWTLLAELFDAVGDFS